MLKILAAHNKGGVFSPPIIVEQIHGAQIIRVRNDRALKKLKKHGQQRLVVAPSALELAGEAASEYRAGEDLTLPLLPRILSGMAELPVGELFVSMEAESAARVIETCCDCARLFTVISKKEGGYEAFDRLYFNKGIILRRVSTVVGRVGATALCVTRGGRAPMGVSSVDVDSLGRIRAPGGEYDAAFEAAGITPTVDLLALAGLTVPSDTKLSLNYGEKIFCLDTEKIM